MVVARKLRDIWDQQITRDATRTQTYESVCVRVLKAGRTDELWRVRQRTDKEAIELMQMCAQTNPELLQLVMKQIKQLPNNSLS